MPKVHHVAFNSWLAGLISGGAFSIPLPGRKGFGKPKCTYVCMNMGHLTTCLWCLFCGPSAEESKLGRKA